MVKSLESKEPNEKDHSHHSSPDCDVHWRGRNSACAGESPGSRRNPWTLRRLLSPGSFSSDTCGHVHDFHLLQETHRYRLEIPLRRALLGKGPTVFLLAVWE